MRSKRLFAYVSAFLPLLMISLASGATTSAHANGLKFDVQLIWATNDEKSPDPKHTPVGPELLHKFEKSPYKWKNYFEVNRKEAVVPPHTEVNVQISPKCAVSISDLGDGR